MNIEETERDTKQNIEEFFEKQLERVNVWLSFAEAKNAGLIAVNVAMLAVIQGLLGDESVLGYISSIFTLLSCGICLYSFVPIMHSRVIRKKNKYNQEKEYNLIFYKDIEEIGKVSIYISLVSKNYFGGKETDCKKVKDLAKEIMENSKIAMNKFVIFKYAVLIDFIAWGCIGVRFIGYLVEKIL